MYITRIRLDHIRGFRELDLQVRDKDRKPRLRTVIIGMNGTNKTTLLRCIAIGLCEREQANALLTEEIGRLISEGSQRATITIELSPGGSRRPVRISTRLQRKEVGDVVYRQDRPKTFPESFLVAGYGAGRAMEGPESGRPYQIVDSVYTMFRYDHTLIDTELTLRRLEDYLKTNMYNKTLKGIKNVLCLSEKDRIDRVRGGGIVVSGPTVGRRIPLQGWADGYRRTFNWILDLYAWGMRAQKVTPTGGIAGILLLDEVEQHLHPSMQMKLIPKLSELLPDLQVFATTHSPLVALGLAPEELVALRREGKQVVAESDLPDFAGYSAEDMLIDRRLFDTEVYKPELQSKFESYRKLALIPQAKRTEKQTRELRSLGSRLRSQESPKAKASPLVRELMQLRQKYGL